MRASPLPVRNGLNPSRIRLPDHGTWPTVAAYLCARFPDDAARLREKIDAGEVVLGDGRSLDATTPFAPRVEVYLHRDPPAETRVPFPVGVLHEDDDILVVDKPHFLATTPRGRHVVESALVRLRRDRDEPDLSPAHRLDRLTAGVLLLTRRPSARRVFQELFASRSVLKRYEAIAPDVPALARPVVLRDRMVKERGSLQARIVDGEVNAITTIHRAGSAGPGHAHYVLAPHTGRTHQLRVHLASVGAPIVDDPLYPVVTDPDPDDWSRPMRLLARSLTFDDPRTGEPVTFTSRRDLAPPDPAATDARHDARRPDRPTRVD